MGTHRFDGANYNPELTCKDIAGMLRTYLRKYKGFKFSVRSTHNNIRVEVKSVPGALLNPEWCYCMLDPELKHRPYFALPKEAQSRYVAEVQNVLDDIHAFLESYNFDDSDPMTDYFHVNFYHHECVDYKLEDIHYGREGLRF